MCSLWQKSQRDEIKLDEAQSQQQARAAAFMSPMQQYGSSILQLTNPDQELLKMELTFRAQILNEDGKQNRSVSLCLMMREFHQ